MSKLLDLPTQAKEAPRTHSASSPSDLVLPGPNGMKRPAFPDRKQALLGAVIVLSLVGLIVGVRYYLHALTHESTDDAFIEGDIIPISPKVEGHVLKVRVVDNQQVTQGDRLVEIDPRDFASRLAQARASLEAALARQKAAEASLDLTNITSDADVRQANARVESARRRVQITRAQVDAAEARLVQAQQNRARVKPLLAEQAVSQKDVDDAIAEELAATANRDAARRQVAEADAQLNEALGRLADAQAAPHRVALSRSQLETAGAEVDQARAAVEQAELHLSYTKIAAPEAGRVTRKTVEEGAFAQVGQPLLAIVPRRVWVIANFKETQLTSMRPGQPVTITVDAYPDAVFHGHVDSIQFGSGARFSLLPPENATGNYVKVVQRVPVKILFDDPLDSDHLLVPGMSVIPDVAVK